MHGASYAKEVGIAHAQCWSHARREIFEAAAADPEGVREGLRLISVFYDIEEQIRDQKLAAETKRLHRLTHSNPHVEASLNSANSLSIQLFAQSNAPVPGAPGLTTERTGGLFAR